MSKMERTKPIIIRQDLVQMYHFFRKKTQKTCTNTRQRHLVVILKQVKVDGQLNLLEKAFPECSNCDPEEFGECLVQYYPEMRDLSANSEELFGSGFEADETCTAFVREFFAQCRNFIPSCQEVKGNQRMALTVLGCLFSHYPDLMLPLLDLHSQC